MAGATEDTARKAGFETLGVRASNKVLVLDTTSPAGTCNLQWRNRKQREQQEGIPAVGSQLS